MASDPPPYDGLPDDDMILRDRLALERTILANERTLLAYIRTALAALATGAALLHFLDTIWTAIGGWALVGLGAALTLIGVARYRKLRGRLDQKRRK